MVSFLSLSFYLKRFISPSLPKVPTLLFPPPPGIQFRQRPPQSVRFLTGHTGFCTTLLLHRNINKR